MSEPKCPPWCASLHDDELAADRRHQSGVRPVAVVKRIPGDAPAAEEMHLVLFHFQDEPEPWVGIDQLQITPESARRLVRELSALLYQVEGERSPQ
ncbi:hypothetical protein FEF26_04270 [Nesterenkonia salmonea]|uniref:Uncharacterized protein n=1 Tax=Nesterenkonia salmonea TaxID=1804987 RepID=A0A5R9BEB7_9MICC|nr:hypothetical protein [Nesterenkonia salmonea]TLP98619.1 hypothetical protein FEF26_04270 [Nesterenkonia salmonea]